MKFPDFGKEFYPVHFNCRCDLGVVLSDSEKETFELITDNEKIDYYETKRIFKLFGAKRNLAKI